MARQKMTVEGGTKGRLLRACMDVARDESDWRAYGPIVEGFGSNGKTVFRQVLVRDVDDAVHLDDAQGILANTN